VTGRSRPPHGIEDVEGWDAPQPSTSTSSGWRAHAACIGVHIDTFFDAGLWPLARSICSRCPVRDACLDEELRIEGGCNAWGRHGFRGGLTPTERNNVKHLRRTA